MLLWRSACKDLYVKNIACVSHGSGNLVPTRWVIMCDCSWVKVIVLEKFIDTLDRHVRLQWKGLYFMASSISTDQQYLQWKGFHFMAGCISLDQQYLQWKGFHFIASCISLWPAIFTNTEIVMIIMKVIFPQQTLKSPKRLRNVLYQCIPVWLTIDLLVICIKHITWSFLSDRVASNSADRPFFPLLYYLHTD